MPNVDSADSKLQSYSVVGKFIRTFSSPRKVSMAIFLKSSYTQTPDGIPGPGKHFSFSLLYSEKCAIIIRRVESYNRQSEMIQK